jgi:hypothetical protein
MTRSKNVGSVLAMTCAGMSIMWGARDAIPAAIITAAMAMHHVRIRDWYRRRVHPSVMAAEADMTGRIKGATSMAPITTAAESANNPEEAMTVEITRSTAMRSRNGRCFSLPKTKRSSTTSRRSSGDN